VLYACGVSDAGRVRKTNEDAFISDAELNLYAVADGMGGHRAGEVASRLALEAIDTFIKRSSEDTDFTWPYGIDDALSLDGNRLRTAIFLANRRVFRAAESRDDYTGMGTTIVGSLVKGARMAIAHVGDSRVYVLAEGRLQQLTVDDSWAAAILANDPTLSPEQLARHPMRNVLTSALGARDQVEVHVTERTLAAGDVMLLCTDGLHGVLDADTIAGILRAHPEVDRAAQALLDAALEAGSRDNVTALVIRHEND
jgi:serine/threonine protein phosphatase PrpC